VRRITLILFAVALSLAGCKKNIETTEAVKGGIVKHLSQNKGLSMTGMDIDVTNVTYKGDEAEATVSFKPKGGDAAAGMVMRYSLKNAGNVWEVVKKADSGAAGHGTTAMPPAPAQDLPPGHPPMGAGTPAPAKKQ
jgi:hypothetical protein